MSIQYRNMKLEDPYKNTETTFSDYDIFIPTPIVKLSMCEYNMILENCTTVTE